MSGWLEVLIRDNRGARERFHHLWVTSHSERTYPLSSRSPSSHFHTFSTTTWDRATIESFDGVFILHVMNSMLNSCESHKDVFVSMIKAHLSHLKARNQHRIGPETANL